MTEQATATQAPVRNIRVFVYGTLKQGHSNHRLLARNNSALLGRCYVEGRWVLTDLGAFPAVVLDKEKTTRVFGEVYETDIDGLATLDLLEGHPSFYQRRKVDTPHGKAWMYHLNARNSSTHNLPIISSGVWQPLYEEKEWLKGIPPQE